MQKLREPLRCCFVCLFLVLVAASTAAQNPTATPIVLHAARLLDVRAGSVIEPGEVLVEGERIRAVACGSSAGRTRD
jgi:hypothetical protein